MLLGAQSANVLLQHANILAAHDRGRPIGQGNFRIGFRGLLPLHGLHNMRKMEKAQVQFAEN
jgi:hypothetical protein